MNIFFSKFLPLFIYPIGFIFFLLLLGLIFARNRKFQQWVMIICFVVVYLAGNRMVSMSLAKSLEWQYMPVTDTQGVTVAVVLGGATEPPLFPRSMVEVNSAGDRVIYAAKLYQEGTVKTLLLSGGTISWLDDGANEEAYTPAQGMKELVMMMGVPESAIGLENYSQNTLENAEYCARILRKTGVKKIILITSAMHMPRSVKLFEAQGLDVIPAPTDYTVTKTGWEELWSGGVYEWLLNLIPTAGNVSLTTSVLKEYTGMMVYRIQGFIQ